MANKFKIIDYVYFIILIGISLMTLSINYNGSSLYINTCYLSIIIGIICILMNMNKMKDYLFIVLILCYICSIVFPFLIYNNSFAYYELIEIITVIVAILYFFLFSNIDNKYILIVLLVLVAYFDIQCLLNRHLDEEVGIKTLKALASNQNQLAAYNVVCILASFKMSFDEKKLKYLSVLPVIFFLYIIWETGSRTSLIASIICIALFIWCLIYKKTVNKRKYIFISIFFLLVVGLLLFAFKHQVISLISRRPLDDMNFEEMMNTLTSGRWNMWVNDYSMFMNGNYIIGRGLSTPQNVVGELGLYGTHIGRTSINFWHNFVLDTLYDGGIVALSLLISIFVYITSFIYKRRKYIKYIIFDIMQIITLFVVYSFDIKFIWMTNLLNIYFMFLIGCVFVKLKKAEKSAYEK